MACFSCLVEIIVIAIGLFGYALFQNDLLGFAGLRKKKIDSNPITDGVYRKYQEQVSMFIPVKWVIKRILAP